MVYGIWPPARDQGAIAGENMVKPGKEYKGNVPSHSLKVVGIALTSSGEIAAEGKFPSRVF